MTRRAFVIIVVALATITGGYVLGTVAPGHTPTERTP